MRPVPRWLRVVADSRRWRSWGDRTSAREYRHPKIYQANLAVANASSPLPPQFFKIPKRQFLLQLPDITGPAQVEVVGTGHVGEGEDRYLALRTLAAVELRRSGDEQIVAVCAALEPDLHRADAEAVAGLARPNEHLHGLAPPPDARLAP